jgi:diguanylate cyclase (GGDEF)-like protein
MANSSSFGRPGQVSDIQQAIMTLGLRSVNVLALSFSLTSAFQGDGDDRFDYTKYWTSSAVTTTASRILAEEYLPQFADEAFLAGILCDFGQLVLAEGAADRYHPVLKRMAKSNAPIHVVEREVLGGDHAEIGGELLRYWGLPPLICGATHYHHDPNHDANTDGDERALAQILNIASFVANIYSGTEIFSGLKSLQEVAREFLGMDASLCHELLEATEANMGEIVEMLGLECNDPAEIAEIRMCAAEHLVKQSIALNQQIQAVSADSPELKKRNIDLEERATTDALTGLRNRGYFDEWLESERERAAQSGHALGLLMLDIDHFKSVNDDHGHQRGDELLKAIASTIQESAGPDNIVCRYGGEEFTVIAPEYDRDRLESLAEDLRVAVARTSVTHAGQTIHRTVSIGGFAHPAGSSPPDSQRLLEIVDTELYRAKSRGRDRIFIKAD